MRKRVGVVGCGRWGAKHLIALQNMPDVVDCIVACDLDEVVLKSVQTESIQIHNNPKTLVDKFDLDAVVVVTPNQTHYSLGKQFLSQGVDVFLEKPMATTFDHASVLASAAVQEGSALKSGFLLRFHPCIEDAKSKIHGGRIGAIQSIHYRKKTTRKDDGVSHSLDSLAIHGVDLAEYLLNDQTPLRISEVIGTRTQSQLTLEYPNQVEIHIDVGWNASTDISELEIMGTDGRILIQLQNHSDFIIENEKIKTVYVNSNRTPLEGVLHDFLINNSPSTASSTGSILRTIQCIEIARSQLVTSGRSDTRELKR
ncbi:MAG: Gfo/Idh/MocA family protein [Candidatus Poseidoniaceae archaeon]